MVSNDPTPQERIARELLSQRPLFIGTDGDGAAHYWDSYERTMAVVPDGADTTADAECHDLSTELKPLAKWSEFVEEKRDWETGPRVGSLFEQLQDCLEAAQ